MALSEARQARVQELFGETGAFIQRQNELLAPILNKLKTIIEKVAIENNYSIVFDASAGSILYAKPSLDITDLILNEMEKTVE
jgi:Skp family chaperone for outer membrane proteins